MGRQEAYGQHRGGWRAYVLKEESLHQWCQGERQVGGRREQVWREERGSMERQVQKRETAVEDRCEGETGVGERQLRRGRCEECHVEE